MSDHSARSIRVPATGEVQGTFEVEYLMSRRQLALIFGVPKRHLAPGPRRLCIDGDAYRRRRRARARRARR